MRPVVAIERAQSRQLLASRVPHDVSIRSTPDRIFASILARRSLSGSHCKRCEAFFSRRIVSTSKQSACVSASSGRSYTSADRIETSPGDDETPPEMSEVTLSTVEPVACRKLGGVRGCVRAYFWKRGL